mgnify:FL=1|jgi:hypothetical protein
MEVIHLGFLEKLNYLMEQNHLNKSTLSKACDIPYTTIDGWYKKGYEGLKLTTLRKLSAYFGVPLDFWANDHIPACTRSAIKQSIIVRLDKMSDEQAKAVLAFIKYMEE